MDKIILKAETKIISHLFLFTKPYHIQIFAGMRPTPTIDWAKSTFCKKVYSPKYITDCIAIEKNGLSLSGIKSIIDWAIFSIDNTVYTNLQVK